MEVRAFFLDTTGLDPHLGSPQKLMQGRGGCRCRGSHGVSTLTPTHPHHRIHIAPLTLLKTRFTTLHHHNSLWRAVLGPPRSHLLVKPVFPSAYHHISLPTPLTTRITTTMAKNPTRTRTHSRRRRPSKARRPNTPLAGFVQRFVPAYFEMATGGGGCF